MVRLRLLILASMVLVGALQINLMMGMGNEKSPLLHAETECALCNKSIKDMQWPEVLAVECADDCHHAILGHRACIESVKETYTCNKQHEGKNCGAHLSDTSKNCINITKQIVEAEKAFDDKRANIPVQQKAEYSPRNERHPLFQWYRVYKDKAECPICLASLVGKRWPDIVTLHCHENQVGHTYCTGCADTLAKRDQRELGCSACRTSLSDASRTAIQEALKVQAEFSKKDNEQHLHPWYLQRHESVTITSNASMRYLRNAMQYRLLRYSAIGAVGALALYGMYIYGNAEVLSVREATIGMGNATCTGGCFGFIAALVHYAHDWYSKK